MYRIAYWIGRLWKAMRLGFRDGFSAPTDRQKRKAEDAVRGLAMDGQIVQAIKLHREIYGSTLKDAKDAVDAMRASV